LMGIYKRKQYKNKNKLLPLNKPAGAQLKMAAFEDTTYRDDPDELNRWGKFYLPKSVTMQVIGVVEGILSRFEEIVLMICGENQHVYAYDEEELHLVASSMKELCDVGIEYPGTTTYYKGQAFKDMVTIWVVSRTLIRRGRIQLHHFLYNYKHVPEV
uniref:Uncharacterized protein n=1 Tax=Amphilophus citrinellus TaxID=61819 RepID=A0A3Q0QQH9_AMPCI